VADVYVRGGQPAGHVFLAKNGLYLFDGNTAVDIGNKVKHLFTDARDLDYINPDFISNAVAASLQDQVVLSYQHGPTPEARRSLFIDFSDPSDIKFAIWKKGFTTLHRDSDNKLIAGTVDGKVYELFTGNEDESLTWWVTSKRFPLTGHTTLEAMDRIVIDADLAGLTTVLGIENDRGQSAQWELTGRGRRKYKRLIPTDFKGNTCRVKLASNGAGRRAWYGVGFGFDEVAVP
jgi:hypothetical protein